MILKKQNVIYRAETVEEIQELKKQGFKEFKPKSKLGLDNKKENEPNKNNKDE